MNPLLRFGRSAFERWRRMRDGGKLPPVTLGVRTAVFDGDKVLLVRHTYMPGWFMPGGAIDRGESGADAAIRELREETWVEGEKPVQLAGFYFNATKYKSDHIALYVCARWSAPRGLATPNMEIAECGFFPLAQLPEGTTRGTLSCLNEIAGESPVRETW
ncbi:MAG TPA: hypothetical protein DCL54_02655 [Alphaproteobacteria bacterium]|nr:hypothetical protein [Alphaproteobacteria bacterium]HAJ45464.1 hypothetical protein [Alphaproteobacteria bacterium]